MKMYSVDIQSYKRFLFAALLIRFALDTLGEKQVAAYVEMVFPDYKNVDTAHNTISIPEGMIREWENALWDIDEMHIQTGRKRVYTDTLWHMDMEVTMLTNVMQTILDQMEKPE